MHLSSRLVAVTGHCLAYMRGPDEGWGRGRGCTLPRCLASEPCEISRSHASFTKVHRPNVVEISLGGDVGNMLCVGRRLGLDFLVMIGRLEGKAEGTFGALSLPSHTGVYRSRSVHRSGGGIFYLTAPLCSAPLLTLASGP